jgi:hypothetical protein
MDHPSAQMGPHDYTVKRRALGTLQSHEPRQPYQWPTAQHLASLVPLLRHLVAFHKNKKA